MTNDDALRAFATLNDAVKKQTGHSVLSSALDLASPALSKIVPASALLIPLLRSVILPMVEAKLSAQEYTELTLSLATIEEGLEDLLSAASAERARIAAMSDAEVDQYLRQNNIIRDGA